MRTRPVKGPQQGQGADGVVFWRTVHPSPIYAPRERDNVLWMSGKPLSAVLVEFRLACLDAVSAPFAEYSTAQKH